MGRAGNSQNPGIMAQTPPGSENDPGTAQITTFHGCRPYGTLPVGIPMPDESIKSPTRDPWRPTFGDIVTVFALVAAIVMWFAPPNWEIGIPVIIVSIAVVAFTALRHPSRVLIRGSIAIFIIAVLLIVAWRPIWESFHKDYPHVAFRWPISFGDSERPTQLGQTQDYTQAQLEDVKAKAVEAATKLIQDKLDQANRDNEALRQTAKQLTDASKATAQSQPQSDTPISVAKVPTSLKLLFKAGNIEEISSQNVVWTKLVVEHEQKVSTLLGERSDMFPVWAIVLIFKKPITFAKVDSDDHGAGLPMPVMPTSNPRYVVLEFGTHVAAYNFQNVLVDITFK